MTPLFGGYITLAEVQRKNVYKIKLFVVVVQIIFCSLGVQIFFYNLKTVGFWRTSAMLQGPAQSPSKVHA